MCATLDRCRRRAVAFSPIDLDALGKARIGRSRRIDGAERAARDSTAATTMSSVSIRCTRDVVV